MKNYKYIRVLYLSPLLLATPAFAAFNLGVSTDSTFGDFINFITSLIYQTIPILILLAFILFFWGLSKFVIGANDVKQLQTGKEYMLWGILALFILVSVRSILTIIASDTFNNNANTAPLLPTSSRNTDTTGQFSPTSGLPNYQQ